MRTVSYVENITSQDPVVHLNCRTHQTLALLASKRTDVDLLFCTALYDTSRIFDHVYRKRLYRWSYDYAYDSPEALDILGVHTVKHDSLQIDDFYALVRLSVARDDVLSFFAPRSQISYQVEYLRNMNVPVEGFLPHSFLVCGVADSTLDLLIRDDATVNHEFANFTILGDTVLNGYHTTPHEWFTDAITIDMSAMSPRSEIAERIYVREIEENRDDYELYEILCDSIPAEINGCCETFSAPGLNALSMIAGSRLLFSRFLKRTEHSTQAKMLAGSTVKAACAIFDEATRLYSAPDRTALGQVQRNLTKVQEKEKALLQLLKEECAAAQAANTAIVTRCRSTRLTN